MPKKSTFAPVSTEEIKRASAIKLTDIKSSNTVLEHDELLAFVAILTTYIKEHTPPEVGSYALYAWADDKSKPECILSFNFGKGRYDFRKKRDSNHISKFNRW